MSLKSIAGHALTSLTLITVAEAQPYGPGQGGGMMDDGRPPVFSPNDLDGVRPFAARRPLQYDPTARV